MTDTQVTVEALSKLDAFFRLLVGRLSMKVAEVLNKLPVLPERRDEIEAQAANIARTFHVVTSFQGPGPKKVGHKAAQRYLARLVKRAQKLSADFDSMPLNLNDAIFISLKKKGLVSARSFDEYFKPSLRLGREVKELINILNDANELLAETASKKGRPVSRPAADVTAAAALAFTRLTGKPATPGYNPYKEERSSFEQFLAEINSVFGIEANTERQAKSLRDKMKKK